MTVGNGKAKLPKSGRWNSVLANQMCRQPSISWFLLGYLCLLLNVGPSAHHADVFGFHCSGCCDSGACHLSKLDISGDCPCCSSSGSSDHLSNSQPEKVKSDCDDCLFCQFFDQFHSLEASIPQQSRESGVCDLFAHSKIVDTVRIIDSSARGPPYTT